MFAKPTSEAAGNRSGIVSVSVEVTQFPTLSQDVARMAYGPRSPASLT